MFNGIPENYEPNRPDDGLGFYKINGALFIVAGICACAVGVGAGAIIMKTVAQKLLAQESVNAAQLIGISAYMLGLLMLPIIGLIICNTGRNYLRNTAPKPS